MADSSVEQRVADVVRRLANLTSLEPGQDFFDAGLASVQALELLLEVETAFGVSLSDEDFARVRTVRELSALITAQGGPA